MYTFVYYGFNLLFLGKTIFFIDKNISMVQKIFVKTDCTMLAHNQSDKGLSSMDCNK